MLSSPLFRMHLYPVIIDILVFLFLVSVISLHLPIPDLSCLDESTLKLQVPIVDVRVPPVM